MNPQFPIYIVSKGRWESRLTAKALDRLGVPFRIVVEEAERSSYAAVLGDERVLVLDPAYQASYDTFSDLGAELGKGSGPARNFAWEHSIAEGAAWHWVVDDNIRDFYRFNHNLKVPVGDGTIFAAMEAFALRWRNLAMAGPNYFMFASRKTRAPPFIENTRIYSCNLIRNDVPFRWRGRYNEDTDLSLRMLKAGWCTVLFNAFLQEKTTTLKMAGGNTDTVYREGTGPKSEMLAAMHPDVAKVVKRWGRIHHFVDYKPFAANRLVLKAGVDVGPEIDNFGMELRKVR